jgi:hypothetical protein
VLREQEERGLVEGWWEVPVKRADKTRTVGFEQRIDRCSTLELDSRDPECLFESERKLGWWRENWRYVRRFAPGRIRGRRRRSCQSTSGRNR